MNNEIKILRIIALTVLKRKLLAMNVRVLIRAAKVGKVLKRNANNKIYFEIADNQRMPFNFLSKISGNHPSFQKKRIGQPRTDASYFARAIQQFIV